MPGLFDKVRGAVGESANLNMQVAGANQKLQSLKEQVDQLDPGTVQANVAVARIGQEGLFGYMANKIKEGD